VEAVHNVKIGEEMSAGWATRGVGGVQMGGLGTGGH
jgi:hypothetical protein